MCAFDQTRCAFGQLRKPNPNQNLTLLKTNPNPDPNPSPNLTPNSIASALRDWSNIAQFVKCCAIDKLISDAARLVKRAIDQMR